MEAKKPIVLKGEVTEELRELLLNMARESEDLDTILRHCYIHEKDNVKLLKYAKICTDERTFVRRKTEAFDKLYSILWSGIFEPLHERWMFYTYREIKEMNKKCKRCKFRGRITSSDNGMAVGGIGSLCCDYLYITGHRRESAPELCERYEAGPKMKSPVQYNTQPQPKKSTEQVDAYLIHKYNRGGSQV